MLSYSTHILTIIYPPYHSSSLYETEMYEIQFNLAPLLILGMTIHRNFHIYFFLLSTTFLGPQHTYPKGGSRQKSCGNHSNINWKKNILLINYSLFIWVTHISYLLLTPLLSNYHTRCGIILWKHNVLNICGNYYA